jgi:8-oxo-dGTP pyrophosphatase MutT (NUDIX family)
MIDRLLAHIAACHNAVLPGGRVAFRIGAAQIGWLRPEFAAALPLPRDAHGVQLADATRLPALARDLAARGVLGWRGEAFDVRASPEGPALTEIDRAALPAFGLWAAGSHVNGLVRRNDGIWLWVARRAADKAIDPGKLDHIVAGGVPAGLSPWQTMLKEAAEEAAIPAALAAQAVPVGRLAYAMERPEGLRRDVLHLYDLWLPEDFIPRPRDGEVESFALWPLARVLATMAEGDAFKFNVSLVLIDLCLRHRLIEPASMEGRALRGALDGGAA